MFEVDKDRLAKLAFLLEVVTVGEPSDEVVMALTAAIGKSAAKVHNGDAQAGLDFLKRMFGELAANQEGVKALQEAIS